MRHGVLGGRGESTGQVRENGLVYGWLLVLKFCMMIESRSWEDTGLTMKQIQESVPKYPDSVLPRMGNCYSSKQTLQFPEISSGRKFFLITPNCKFHSLVPFSLPCSEKNH